MSAQLIITLLIGFPNLEKMAPRTIWLNMPLISCSSGLDSWPKLGEPKLQPLQFGIRTESNTVGLYYVSSGDLSSHEFCSGDQRRPVSKEREDWVDGQRETVTWDTGRASGWLSRFWFQYRPAAQLNSCPWDQGSISCLPFKCQPIREISVVRISQSI